jgi:hypothetical protein
MRHLVMKCEQPAAGTARYLTQASHVPVDGVADAVLRKESHQTRPARSWQSVNQWV